MSTFTEWNGPHHPHIHARGPNTKDLLALIEAYNNANTALVKHLADTAADDVHGFSTALKEAIADLETALKALIGEKADADALEELAAKVSDNATAISEEAARAAAAENIIETALAEEADRAEAAETALNDAVGALETALGEFKETYLANSAQIEYDGEDTTTISDIVDVTEYLISTIKIRNYTDIVEWTTFNAQYAGTGTSTGVTNTNGIYVLGKMSTEWTPDMGFDDTNAPKTARAHIKYINAQPFDLIVDMTATSATEGSITCLASFEKPWTLDDPTNAWEDMALHLLTNVDSSGSTSVFLAISAKGLSGQSTTFHVAGENFIPGGTVNGISGSIGFTRVKQGFNGNRANLDDLRIEALNDAYGKTILKVEYTKDVLGTQHKDLYIADPSFQAIYFLKRPSVIFATDEDDADDDSGGEISPVLTTNDLDDIGTGQSIAGIIVFWPLWEDAEAGSKSIKKAINVPEGWLACDGSTVSAEDYPSLFEALGISGSTWTLPIMDYAIIRVKTLFEDVSVAADTSSIRVLTHMELTEAIVNVQANLDVETEERIAADEQLQANIDAEEAARIEADEQLQANIDAEEAARIEADETLQANIDAEEAARIEADETLQANIDAEEAARIAADETLQANIDAEAQAREEADTALQEALDEEAAMREAADTTLQEQIDELDKRKAELWTGTQAEFDSEKSGLSDDTIVMSDEELEDD